MLELSDELRDLYDIIEDYLVSAGFKRIVYNNELPDYKYFHSTFNINSDLKQVFDKLKGIGIRVDRIYRSNGAKQDTSYRVSLSEWNDCSIIVLSKIKLTIHDSDKLIKKKLASILNLYNNIKKDKCLF